MSQEQEIGLFGRVIERKRARIRKLRLRKSMYTVHSGRQFDMRHKENWGEGEREIDR